MRNTNPSDSALWELLDQTFSQARETTEAKILAIESGFSKDELLRLCRMYIVQYPIKLTGNKHDLSISLAFAKRQENQAKEERQAEQKARLKEEKAKVLWFSKIISNGEPWILHTKRKGQRECEAVEVPVTKEIAKQMLSIAAKVLCD